MISALKTTATVIVNVVTVMTACHHFSIIAAHHYFRHIKKYLERKSNPISHIPDKVSYSYIRQQLCDLLSLDSF